MSDAPIARGFRPETPLGFNPTISIDPATLIALRQLAAPFLIKARRGPLVRKVQALLAAKFPGKVIFIKDCTDVVYRNNGQIALGVLVNGIPDQGLIFGRPRNDGSIFGVPANDR